MSYKKIIFWYTKSHGTYDLAKTDGYGKTVVYQSACHLVGEFICLFFSFLYSLIVRETKQAFCIHLTALGYDKIYFVSLLMGENRDQNV